MNLVIGKFLPLHKGHEFLLRSAVSMGGTADVIIGIGKDDPYSFTERSKWIYDILWGSVNVYGVLEPDTSPTYDENGTAQEEWYWDYWVNAIKKTETIPRRFLFTSDLYGKELARRTGLVWVPVDPDRQFYNISGTKIREDVTGSWDMLPATVRRSLSKRVAIVGPESSGKTTMVNNLGKYFKNSKIVHEYGRILSEQRKNELTGEDFSAIYRIQNLMIEKAAEESSLVISDTEEFTTLLFSKMYLGEEVGYPLLGSQEFDLYLLLEPNVPLIDDGERISKNDEERYEFFNSFKEYLTNTRKKFAVINQETYEDRLSQAVKLVNSIT